MKITQKGYFRDFISDFGPSQKNSEKSPVSVKKTRTHSKWVIDGCSHFFLLKHKDVNSGKMNPPEKNFLFGHLSFFYADFHQLNIKIFILTISYNHITGLRILFPVYTFHFLSSSCVCSSEGLPAIWGLPVSESTILKSHSPSDLWSWKTHFLMGGGEVSLEPCLSAAGGGGQGPKQHLFVEINYICIPHIQIYAKLWENKCLRYLLVSAILSAHLTLYLRLSLIK